MGRGIASLQWIFIVTVTAFSMIAVAAAAVCWILLLKRKKKKGQSISEPRHTLFDGKQARTGQSISEPSHTLFDGKQARTTPTAPPDELVIGLQATGPQTLLHYELKDLEAATGNFNAANRIGRSVYRGAIDGTPVAVKKIQGDVSQQIGIFQKLNHFNLVRLMGFCVTESRSYLAFEYAENESLADYLQGNSPVLSWRQRLEIALDMANGLHYLHNYAYVHTDIKSSNVLLDCNLRAKIANFGLAKSAGEGFVVTRHVMGTKGYMAPEYGAHGLVTPNLDVFSFGVVILELLSGKPAVSPLHGEAILWTAIGTLLEGSNPKEKLKGFIDPALKNAYPLDMAYAMAEMARACVDEDLNRRPTMDEIQRVLSMWQSVSSSPSLEVDRTDSYVQRNSFNIIQTVLSRRGSGSYTKIK